MECVGQYTPLDTLEERRWGWLSVFQTEPEHGQPLLWVLRSTVWFLPAAHYFYTFKKRPR